MTNTITSKSFGFGISMVMLCKRLTKEQKEFVLSRQILRSGTAIGAHYREAEYAESKADFIHKMAVAQKECNETLYWLELLKATNYISETEFEQFYQQANELMKIITRIIKTAKANHQRKKP